MIALLLMAANPVGDRMFAARDAYKACVVREAVELGSPNQETADTILRAVDDRCRPQWTDLQMAFPGADLGGSAAALRDQTLTVWRRQAQDAGIAALLEARAHRP